ncbi:extracellular catalytic domain type 1 short-chain-length polyhydroxyalkanoate depolymerase [Chitinophaga niabensis]|uniref:Polyhydroxybutyrate depolymerase n=1 Tax=Chitinophaga niabensis TaxID=536979 RepID=A0A1N6FG93_9BACT|nr:PHB depolymerase family esterase [Chitinophaga niabensis]SIN94279.1 polyhydroxybutyrate depolymerase [Chitinophaga niabensis]
MKTVLLSLLCFCSMGCLKKKESTPANGSITVDGLIRTYTLHLPPNYREGSDFSLVIAMHGGGGNGGQFESSSRLSQKADAAKFIVVYPNGVKGDGLLKAQTWNAGGCCDYARDHNINDVKFISLLIDHLVAKYKINPKKVYATGHSNGGMMAYRLACELSDKIAAIAPNSSTMVVTQPCNASRAVPILHMHSVQDNNVPYAGGVGTGVSKHYNPPLDSVFQVWSLKNACATPAQVIVNNNSYKLTKWTDCSNNTTIQYYLTKDGGHAWPGGTPGGLPLGDKPSAVINANDLLWDFFQQYQLP